MSKPISRFRSDNSLDTSAEIANPRFVDFRETAQNTSTAYILVRDNQTLVSDGNFANNILIPPSRSSSSSHASDTISNIHLPFLGNGLPFRA